MSNDYETVCACLSETQRLLDISQECVRELRCERDEARRLLGHARATLIGIAGATARAWELPRNEFIDEFLPWAQSRARDTAAKTAIHAPAVDGEPS